jgi:hypothetical protein
MIVKGLKELELATPADKKAEVSFKMLIACGQNLSLLDSAKIRIKAYGIFL